MKNIKLKQKRNLHTVILADPKLSDGAKVVAGALLFMFHNTKSGECFPCNATVGAAVGMGARTVRRHIGGLVRSGYVFRDPRYNNSCITDFNWVMGSDEAIAAVRERARNAKADRTMKCTPPGGRRSGRQIDHPPGVLLFELGRAPVSKRGMEPLAVVDLLDEAGQ